MLQVKCALTELRANMKRYVLWSEKLCKTVYIQ